VIQRWCGALREIDEKPLKLPKDLLIKSLKGDSDFNRVQLSGEASEYEGGILTKDTIYGDLDSRIKASLRSLLFIT